MSPTGSIALVPGDTTQEVQELQRRIHSEMGGLGRIHVMASMFRRMRTMLSLKYDDPMEMLRHLHGEELSEHDYTAISYLLGRSADGPPQQ